MVANHLGVRSVRFVCHAQTHRFREFCRKTMGWLEAGGFGRPKEMWVQGRAVSAGTDGAGVLALLAEHSGDAPGLGDVARFEAGAGVVGAVRTYPPEAGPDTALCTLELELVVEFDTPVEAGLRFQQGCVALCAAMQTAVPLHSAQLSPDGGGCACIPDVALVDGCSHLAIASLDEVAERYADPQAFWDAGWTVVAEHRGQRLLSRAMNLIAGPGYLEQILPHQWAMARAAKAEETGYSDPDVLPEEEALFHGGAARLHFVGHDPATRLAEYACALGAGEHVQGWEVFALRQIVRSGQMPGGEPVETVQIVFAQRWMAESEKRPLLDIGCHVCVQAVTGGLEQVTG